MTMQGWVTRNRLREEQEQAKIEQARKEGFADGYLAGKTFNEKEIVTLRERVAELEGRSAKFVTPKEFEKYAGRWWVVPCHMRGDWVLICPIFDPPIPLPGE